MHNIMQLEPLW